MKKIQSMILTLVFVILIISSAFITASAETDNTPLTFTGTEPYKINLVKNGSTSFDVSLQYSLDNINWNVYTPGNAIEVNNSAKTVYFRGSGNNAFSIGLDNYYYWSITETSGKVSATGNINTLLDYDNPPTEFTDANNYCFLNMFKDCTSLASAPILPATTLSDYCYDGMFRGCTSLLMAPELPATSLDKYCYAVMFKGCTSLVIAPELLSTALADYCYSEMFADCSALRTAPGRLPATTLTTNCYYCMFSGCSELRTAPELKATELANFCYSNMFNACAKLKVFEVTDIELADWITPASTSATMWNYRMCSTCKIATNKMYRYQRPITPTFNNSFDSGYYDQEDGDDEGIISFTAFLSNFSDFEGYTFDTTNDKFGMMIYKPNAIDSDKVNLQSIDFANLIGSGKGYFYTFVTGIKVDDFDKTVIAKPYAIIDGETTWGSEMTTSVTTLLGTKFLGDISNKPEATKESN